ncbi:site-2 protease family protein [Alkalibacter rhizosphaerae]|uniref:Site-2 protease family protein n=1 Tax=Alkalibacter rhizosphaerae TaxID=2815577 RepID=A0A974XFI3_9FIRM|nr:site-2 protease family protein [Alkalibacter rhizosphaerae]QSX08909.1 site-2 protease family protein [Alkalibacter rhizosphaerae]
MTDLLANVRQIAVVLPALLISITFHELAHGYTAYLLGDPTAKQMGRLTLNPIKHMDPTGLIMLFLFRFGWAKPVPFNPNYFKNRKMGTLAVAVAGPASNLIIATASMFSFMLAPEALAGFFGTLVQFNILFAVFNLLPIPPLDGSKIIASLLPLHLETIFWKYERYGYMLLLVLAVSGIIGKLITPIYGFILQGLLRFVYLFF